MQPERQLEFYVVGEEGVLPESWGGDREFTLYLTKSWLFGIVSASRRWRRLKITFLTLVDWRET